MTRLLFEQTLLPTGWHQDVAVALSESGLIESVIPDSKRTDTDEFVPGICTPGMPNLHSHAFQRAMAGLTEQAGSGSDSFWTWRQVMYEFVERIGPDELEAIAAQLYVEMLKAGYTSVAEFHYLHHAPGGAPYDDPAELSKRVIEAAQHTGIAITHLPVLYAFSDFGSVTPRDGQARFVNDGNQYCQIVTDLYGQYKDVTGVRIGMAPHSLRAVSEDLLKDVTSNLDRLSLPIHIHIAEQIKEVDDCTAWSDVRPVTWLMDHFDVDARWCLVHATHMDDAELTALAKSGAVAGLCPTTEANLGDGLFSARAYLDAGGRLGIGSDSNISIDPTEEMRLLEYGQRLTTHGRNILTDGPGASTGRSLFDHVTTGGAQALGLNAGKIVPGARADFVVLDADHPGISGRSGDSALDAWIFTNAGNPVRDVYVGGTKVVSGGFHRHEEQIAAAYRSALAQL